MSESSLLRQRRNEREVTDPVTHLPLTVHDHVSGELDDLLPRLSEEQDQLSPDQRNEDEKDDSKQHHVGLEHIIGEELRRRRWQLPGDSDVQSRTKIETAIVAACATAAVGPLGLIGLWAWSKIFGRSGFGWFELLSGTIGCLVLALCVGACVLFVPFSYLLRYLEENIEPQVQKSASPEIPGPDNHPSQEHPESATWLNSLFRTLWPIVNPALFTSISDMLEDALQASLPKLVHGVRVADIGQGSEPLRILGIRFLDAGRAGHDIGGMKAEVGDFFNLEVAVAYRARTIQGTKGSKGLRGRAGNAHLLMEFLIAGGVVIPVWVELTGLLATMRMRVQLTPNPPFFALTTLTLLGQPKIKMVCTPLAKNFLNVMDVPGLSGWIQRAIDDVVSAYVAPRSITLDLKTLLMGRENTDTNAVGALVVTVRNAKEFKDGDGGSIFRSKEKKRGDPYVCVGWSKWGKPLWSTRIIKSDGNPVWEETTVLLVGPSEIHARESLRLQLFDSDLLTADDHLGTVDFPLKDIMEHSENRISARQDRLTKVDGTFSHGTLSWECGYFSKTTLEQHLDGRHSDVSGLIQRVEDEVENKLREASIRDDKTGKLDQQKKQDLAEKAQEIMAKSQPREEWPSGILYIKIEQITGLEVEKVRQSGVKEGGDDDEAEDLPSAYCTVIINHQRVYKTRTKMKSNNPFYNASTEKFIRDWRSTFAMIAVRDARAHEVNPLLGVVVLPLHTLLTHRGVSHLSESFPLVGGIGYGRMHLSLTFRSVQLQLPTRLLGWEIGTLDIAPRVTASFNLPPDLAACRLVFRTQHGKGKMEAHLEGGWRPRNAQRNIRVAVTRRYASSLVVEFRKQKHKMGLGSERVPAFAVLWLKDLSEGHELDVTLGVYKSQGGALARAEANCVDDAGNRVGEITIKLCLWPGLSGYHQGAADKDIHMADVMEALDCAEESGEVERDLLFDEYGIDDPSSSDKDSDDSQRRSVNGESGGFRAMRRRQGELHRKHRGLMQWQGARNLAWAGRGVEHAVDKVSAKITGKFKHHENDIGIEKEV
ncbi:hypothetical protein H0H87_002986 [Tephrocybe sp. NHM501043]|nr:hypothetical protein H0H87_002986 [Tephrocybe sp. NHM501043]